MGGTELTGERATAWLGASPRAFTRDRWEIGGLFVLMVALVANTRSAEDGPGPTFALVFALACAAAVGLRIGFPWLSAVTGAVAAAIGMVAWLPTVPGVLLMAGWAGWLANWLWFTDTQRRRQRRIAGAARQPLPDAAKAALRDTPTRAPYPRAIRFLLFAGVGLAVFIAVLGYVSYAAGVFEDEADAQWFGLALSHVLVVGAILALAWFGREELRHRALARAPETDAGVPVLLDRGERAWHIRSLDGTRLATVRLSPDDPGRIVFAQAAGRLAYLVGGIGEGDLGRVVTAAGEVTGALNLTLAEVPDGYTPDEDQRLAVTPAVPPQPISWSSPPMVRLGSRLMLAGALLLPLVTFPLLTGVWQRLSIAVFALGLAVASLIYGPTQVSVDGTRLLQVSPWERLRVPTWTIAQVQQTHDQRVILADARGESIELEAGDAGALVAANVAGFIESRVSHPGAGETPGFASEQTRWRRLAPVSILAVPIVVALVWIIF